MTEKKGDEEVDPAIEQWKIRRMIKTLNDAKGAGTSMISLIVPGKDDINRVNKMLTEEMGTASSIKSRVNRLSVLGAITSTQQRLKLYNRTPPNGLIIYCGTITTAEGKEKKVTIDIEPYKPIHTSMYLCDNKFHTEDLSELLEDDDKYGFLIMDGNGSLYGTVQGNHREVLHKFSVDLPKKHGRGGQSALRFARLRLEKRHNYVRKVGELCTQFFIDPATNRPNIKGLIMAGSAEFKNDLASSDLIDPRLLAVLLQLVDVSYGGENGFNQAIELASESMKNVKFIQEKRLITKFLDEVAQDTGKYCFGIKDTVAGLEMGAVETLIVWENLEIQRIHIRNPHADVTADKIMYLTPTEAKNEKLYRDEESGAELEVVENIAFVEWIVTNYKNFGAKLEFITDRSQEGNQFVKGFGGVGGMLRYRVDFDEMDEDEYAAVEADSDDDDFM
jgi:peptide chain release factor subunit 1